MDLRLDDFIDDTPWQESTPALQPIIIPDQIEGVELRRLVTHGDGRGDLTVLFSRHYVPEATAPHVYLVNATAGSLRAWVYHRRQSDRLAFLNGTFRVVLYDLRPESPTKGGLNVLDVGADNPVQVTIPPFVAHAVQNRGSESAFFVNMPTNHYDPANPDKARIRKDHPGIPYSFD